MHCNGPQLHMNSRFFAKIMQLPTYPEQLNQDLPKHRHRYRVRCADPQKGLSVQFKGCHPGKKVVKLFTQIKSESEST